MTNGDASGHIVIGRGRGFVGVVVDDAPVCHLDGVAQRPGDAAEGDLECRLGDPELVDLGAVEGAGQAAQSGIAVAAHLGDDGGHFGRGTVLLVDGGGQGGAQRSAVASVATKVDSTEGHSQAMVPDHLWRPALGAVAACPWRPPFPLSTGRCHAEPMATTAAELSSLATAVDEITRRITAHAEAADAEKDEEMAAELFAIERSLTTANRRLARLTVALSRRSA